MAELEFKTRWDICEQCMDKWISDKVIKKTCKDYLQNNRHKKWCNPFYSGIRESRYQGWVEGSSYELCNNCKFAFEHGIFDQENLDE